MKITITSTDNITQVHGVPVRLWHGVTERGIRCLVFVRSLMVHTARDTDQFDRELIETGAPAELRVALSELLLAHAMEAEIEEIGKPEHPQDAHDNDHDVD